MLDISIAIVLGSIAALVCTILALVMVTPEKKRATLPKFFQFVHDLFNFKFLLLEKVLKALYIFLTLFCLAGGFFMLLAGRSSYFGFHSYAGMGLLLILLGPIAVRLVYEGLMLFILLVKNTIEINGKLKKETDEKSESIFDAPTPDFIAEGLADYVYCTQCGTRYDKKAGNCPNCNQQ